MISLAYGPHRIIAVMRGAQPLWSGSAVGLSVTFAEGLVTVTSYGSVPSPRVIFGAGQITLPAM